MIYEFNYKMKITSKENEEVLSSCHDISRQQLYQYLSTYFDFDDTMAIRAIGGLLKFALAEHLLADHEIIMISHVETYHLEGYMYMDPSALHALQIFCDETHPSMLKGRGKSKVGFSVHGLLDRTVSKPGSQLLKSWMRQPLVDVHTITMRHEAVSFLLQHTTHQAVQDMVNDYLYHVLIIIMY